MTELTTISLQALGIGGTLLASGFSFAFTWSVLPDTVRMDPPTSLPFFRTLFTTGGLFVVPVAGIAGLATALAAYRDPARRLPLSLASALTFGPVLFTRVVMYPGIRRLLVIGEAAPEKQRAAAAEVAALLRAWSAQNLARAGMAFAAGAYGLSLLVQKVEVKRKSL